MTRRLVILVLVLALLLSTGVYSSSNGDQGGVSEISSSVVGSKFVDVREGRLIQYHFDVSENTTSIPNSEGSGYDGLVRGNVTGVSGKYGSAVRFDGLEGNVTIENSSSAPLDNETTVAFWIKPESQQTGNVLKGPGSYSFFLRSNTMNFVVIREGDRIAQLRADVPRDEWSHVVGVYDPEEGARLFVDGEVADENATVRGPMSSPYENVTLNTGSWRNGFNGSIDEFSFWTRSLSKTEVQMVEQDRDRGLIFSDSLRIAMTVLLLFVIAGVTVRDHVF